jgi:hypothetical protein
MLWGVGVAMLLCAAILVWGFGFGPSLQVQPTRSSGGSGTERSNQGAGESTAAKNNAITPEPSPAGGAGQNASGEAEQIERSTVTLKLTDAQRQQIRSYFAGNTTDRADDANFTLSIGAAVPRQVQLQKLPAQVTSVMQGFDGDEYILVRDQLVIVEPNARRVVAIVPNVG